MWSELGKQNMQAKKVYYSLKSWSSIFRTFTSGLSLAYCMFSPIDICKTNLKKL